MTGGAPTAPTVSIIVIACDVRDEVVRCLDSVERHAGEVPTELILVDNGSRDGTSEAVARRFPAVRIIRREANEGVVARNHGLRCATGAMRMFLDSDARLTPGALPELVRFVREHPGVGLVGPRLVYSDGRLQLSTRRFPPLALPLLRRPPLRLLFEDAELVRRHLMADDPHDEPREVEYVLGACQLFTEAAQRAAGEIDERMFFGPDDADWCLRIRQAGFRIAYDPAATVVHDYRRSTSRRPLSTVAVRHLMAFVHFQWKWRRERRRLVEEGRRIDLRGGAL